jgi:hypothetical protein
MSESYEDGVPVDVHEQRIRRARKEHRCCACKRAIEPGSMYCNEVYVWDGTLETNKRCGACQKTYEHLSDLCRQSEDHISPRPDLGCGLRYQGEWGDLPDEIAALAFMTDAEASALLEKP